MTDPSCMTRDLQQNFGKQPDNMKIAMICFTMTGLTTGEKLREAFLKDGEEVTLEGKSRYLPDSITATTSQWAEKKFRDHTDAIIFIGACGIAVRSIAPYIAGKKTDPAVLVIDECGKFVISLLSGHLGGANELALRAAGYLQAVPVVTTATDLHERFAVDVFAKKNGCAIFPMTAAKEVSAAILSGDTVGFYSEFPWEGELPGGLILCDREGTPVKKKLDPPKTGVAVTLYSSCRPFEETVYLVPPAVVLGMGCRRGKDRETVMNSAEAALRDCGLFRESLKCLASIDLKKDEAGLLALSEMWKIPFLTFSGEELKAVEGDFTPSAFVKNITGVDNVCERSAVLASEGGRLIKKKTGGDGVTTALAAGNWRIGF